MTQNRQPRELFMANDGSAINEPAAAAAWRTHLGAAAMRWPLRKRRHH